MIRWEHLDTATVPGGDELRLMRRGTELSIMAGSNTLMSSRMWGSEEALAELTCEKLGDRKNIHMLIGGLGMGFTLRAALAALGPDAKLTVAELVPAIVEWARGPMAPIFGDCLDDPRVAVKVGDVMPAISNARGTYDAILLDVDNGPEALTRDSNDRIYTMAGLRAAHTALRPGGVLAVWSSAPDAAFTRRLGQAGFSVDERKVRARGKSGGARHVIWFGTKP